MGIVAAYLLCAIDFSEGRRVLYSQGVTIGNANSSSPASFRGLVVDLDNTLYDFDGFFARSLRALIHAVARTAKVSEADVERDVSQVIRERGTLEYAALIEELRCIQLAAPSDDQLERVVRAGRAAFRRTRDKHLMLYPAVRSTLRWARSENFPVIALSDAPAFQAEGRLRHLNLTTYFAALYSWEGYTAPSTLTAWTKPYTSRVPRVHKLAGAERKPNTVGLVHALESLNMGPADVLVVGDRVDRDIRVANAVGATSVWARYGSRIDSESQATLDRLFPWQKEARALEVLARETVKPCHIIDTFDDVRGLLSGQPRLF